MPVIRSTWSCFGPSRRRSSGKRQDRRYAEQADGEVDRPPAVGRHRILQDQRQQHAGEIVAAGHRRDGHAPAAHEPVRDIGHQRPEHGAGPDADQNAVHDRELPHRVDEGGGDKADPERNARRESGKHHSDPIDQTPDHDVPQRKEDHRHRVGDGGCCPVDVELGLHRRHHDHVGPEPDAPDRRHNHGDGETKHGVARIRRGTVLSGGK